jgi:hypothetical protein
LPLPKQNEFEVGFLRKIVDFYFVGGAKQAGDKKNNHKVTGVPQGILPLTFGVPPGSSSLLFAAS